MTDFDIAEFREYLKTDKHALDQELQEQPMLMFKVSEAFAHAASERDMLKEHVATADAKLDSEARRLFDKREEKYTEAMIKNAVQVDKKHEKATEEYFNAKEHA